jgi:hypothetical protein
VAPKWLSNLKEDPREERNWWSESPAVAADLEARLAQWAAQMRGAK